MSFWDALFGSNEFSASDYGKQKQQDVAWQQYAAKTMPLHQRQGLEAAGYNPLLGQTASSAVELSGGQSAGAGQASSEGDNSAMSMMQMASMKKDMQIKDSQVDIARAEADVKKSEADEIVRHNKAQEKYERDLNKEQIYQNNFNEQFRKDHKMLGEALDYIGWTPYGSVGKLSKAAIEVMEDVIRDVGFFKAGSAIKNIGLKKLQELANDAGEIKRLLYRHISILK